MDRDLEYVTICSLVREEAWNVFTSMLQRTLLVTETSHFIIKALASCRLLLGTGLLSQHESSSNEKQFFRRWEGSVEAAGLPMGSRDAVLPQHSTLTSARCCRWCCCAHTANSTKIQGLKAGNSTCNVANHVLRKQRCHLVSGSILMYFIIFTHKHTKSVGRQSKQWDTFSGAPVTAFYTLEKGDQYFSFTHRQQL